MASLGESTRIVQLKVRLLGLSPMIWRRVLVPESVSLRELHGILQVNMGWEGTHLYYFDIYAVHYGAFELDAESPDLPFSAFGFRERERFTYLYDMGDYWEHEGVGSVAELSRRWHKLCMANPKDSTPIVQLKVRLLGIRPMIWRRVLAPASVSLRELHGILQVSMGWEGACSDLRTSRVILNKVSPSQLICAHSQIM